MLTLGFISVVSYMYLATIHLFMAGIAFFYAIWHSATVRSRLTLVDVEYTVQAATSVLADLVEKCPPAHACKDAFDRMSKATIKMSLSTTGFKPSLSGHLARSMQQDYKSSPNPQATKSEVAQVASIRPTRPPPQFDMNLRDLFPEMQDGRTFDGGFGHWQSPAPHILPMQPTPQYHQAPNDSNVSSQYHADVKHSTVNPSTKPLNDAYTSTNDLDFVMTSESTAMYGGNPGLDFGSAGDHNWADGTQLDLFDGFFFGGTYSSE